MITRVNGEEGIACSNERRNVIHCFQVIGIRAPRSIPFRGIDGALGIVHDILWGASRARVLTHGLLCKDRRELRAFDRGDMTRRGKSETVAEAEGGRKIERGRAWLFNPV